MTPSQWVILLLVPPVNLACFGLLLAGRNRWLKRLGMAALVLLVGLGMPQVAERLLASLEVGLAHAAAASVVRPQAIVILGADVSVGYGPNGRLTAAPGPLTLERLRAGAALARSSGLPVLVSGGIVDDQAPPVATLMARSLRADFGMVPRWVEDTSPDTWGNAQRSAAMLRPAGIGAVLLVTHAWHMRRSQLALRRAGMPSTAAPPMWDRKPKPRWTSLVPAISGWVRSYDALHEWVGWLWYELR